LSMCKNWLPRLRQAFPAARSGSLRNGLSRERYGDDKKPFNSLTGAQDAPI
jgi:hypothetical protein